MVFWLSPGKIWLPGPDFEPATQRLDRQWIRNFALLLRRHASK